MPNTGGNLKIWMRPATPTINITVYAKYSSSPTGETTSNYGLYYALSSDGVTYGSDTLIVLGSAIDAICSSVATISVPQNYYGAFGFRTVSTGKGGGGRNFEAIKNTSTCPAAALTYCGTYELGGSPYAFNWSTSNFDLAFTIYVNVKAGSIFQTC